MLDIFERDIVDIMHAVCKKNDYTTIRALFTASGRDLAKLVNAYYEDKGRWEDVVI